MKIDGVAHRTIWLAEDGWRVCVIDQTRLPFRFEVATLANVDEAAHAIRAMIVRGAPLIGATAAYGVALAARADASDAALAAAYAQLLATRPTAVNLAWALDDLRAHLAPLPVQARAAAAYARAAQLCDADVACNRAIGEHGAQLLRHLWKQRAAAGAQQLHVLTHCNAGWLATVDWGTALAPIYAAHDEGLPVHVWVDETRPRNQGASLTAWELGQHGVPHTVIADNAGGHLMQHGMVDVVLVGTDRTTATGDVCNKIGTYLKALAAKESGVPFYVAAPSSSIDWRLSDGVREIPIEERSAREQTHLSGRSAAGELVEVQVTPDGSAAKNFAFDVTPARFVTGVITERGVAAASRAGLAALFPERAQRAGAATSAPAATLDDHPLRLQLIETCRALRHSGLTFGTSGNVSLRRDATSFLVSPTGVDYDTLAPEDLPVVQLGGDASSEPSWSGAKAPSSEWRFHRDLLRARPEAFAIVHTHSPYATALACRGEGIPAFHYMVAVAGGIDVRCAPYFTYGTQALSDAALTALADRRACLLANHGVIAIGADARAALKLAGEVENLARQYLTSLIGGAPRLLEEAEMLRVVEKFKTYGVQPAERTDPADPAGPA